MPQIITNPRDSIDEMIEKARGVSSMLNDSPAQRAARKHLDDAVEDLTRARGDLQRSAGQR